MFKAFFTHWIGGNLVYWYEEFGSNLDEMKSAARVEWKARKGVVALRLYKKIGAAEYELIEEFTK